MHEYSSVQWEPDPGEERNVADKSGPGMFIIT